LSAVNWSLKQPAPLSLCQLTRTLVAPTIPAERGFLNSQTQD
jgi:hypothetical protein